MFKPWLSAIQRKVKNDIEGIIYGFMNMKGKKSQKC